MSARNRLRASIKNAVVTLAIWGVLPLSLADYLVKRGGLTDA